MKSTSNSLSLAAIVALGVATTARADLEDRGTTTRDTETGLEWLDVDQTLDVSAYDIIVGGHGGLAADGWVHATVEEIETLLLHANMPPPFDGSLTPGGLAGAELLLNLLGATGSTSTGAFIQGFSGTLASTGGPPYIRYTPVILTGSGVGGADLLGATVPSSAHNPTIGNYLVRPASAEPLHVKIDIKPFSARNPLNPRSAGVVPVAILTTADFDAPRRVDPETVRFGSVDAGLAHPLAAIVDVNGDGSSDLLLHIRTQVTGLRCGDTTAWLTAETYAGEPLEGSDRIITVGCSMAVDGGRLPWPSSPK